MLDPVARRVNGRPVYSRIRGDSDPDGEASDDFLYYWEFDNGHNWIIRYSKMNQVCLKMIKWINFSAKYHCTETETFTVLYGSWRLLCGFLTRSKK